ncbi:hypothetical protein ERJ75_000296400 [Trypanosoma vivax]|nr:hypothetical protein ERJ75_000296400 [Trypanosoma vivax]
MKAALETLETKGMLNAATRGALQSKHRAAIAEARAEEALSNAQLATAGAAGARAAAVNTTVARGTAEDAVQSSVKAVQAATKAREAAAAAVKVQPRRSTQQQGLGTRTPGQSLCRKPLPSHWGVSPTNSQRCRACLMTRPES